MSFKNHVAAVGIERGRDRLDAQPWGRCVREEQSLGFAIPYLHDGRPHDYVPDFIVRLDNGLHVILETKGYDELEEVKAQAAYRWCDAVNADGSFGEWRYAVTHDPNAISGLIDELAVAVAVA
jgi:type III restriction enzyme